MYIFGGCTGIAKETNDLYYYNFDNNKWEVIYEKQEIKNTEIYVQKGSRKDSILKSKTMMKQSGQNLDTPINALLSKTKYEQSPKNKLFQGVKKSALTNEPYIILPKKADFDRSFRELDTQTISRSLSPKGKNQLILETKQYIPSSPTFLSMKNSIILKIPISKYKKSQFSENKSILTGKIPGKIPCERDGHASANIENKLIIFGGDRHHMGFNDLYLYDPELNNS